MNGLRVDDEWSRLERVVLGRAESLVLPASVTAPGDDGAQPGWWRRLAASRDARQRCEDELGQLAAVLEARAVDIVRPRLIARLERRPLVASQLFVRDTVAVIGDVAFAALAANPARSAEPAALASLVPGLAQAGAPPPGASLDGGDVLVDLPRVYVGIGGHRTNREGAEYLQAQLGDAVHVVCVRFRTRQPAHLDCCLTLTGPGRGIVYRGAFDGDLPAPLDGYDLIEVDTPTFEQLGVNVLMVDPGTVIAQARHAALRSALAASGISVLSVDFTQHVSLGGGIRCATAPLRRVPKPSPGRE